MKANRRGLALPLGVLLASIVLAFLRPADEPMVPTKNGAGVAVVKVNHVPTGANSLSSEASPVLGAVAVVVIFLAVGLAILFFFRLFIRRGKAGEYEHYYERPRASLFDIAMLAAIVLLGGVTVFGLRTVLFSHALTQDIHVAAAHHVSTPADERPSSITPKPTHMAQESKPSTPLGVVLSVLAGFAALLFVFLGQRSPSMRSERGLGSAVPVDLSGRDSGEGEETGIRRAYADMCRILSPVASDEASLTPREYAAKVRRSGIECPAVRTLTRLFELDRYGAGRDWSTASESTNEWYHVKSSNGESLDRLLASVVRSVGTTTGWRRGNRDTAGGPRGHGTLR